VSAQRGRPLSDTPRLRRPWRVVSADLLVVSGAGLLIVFLTWSAWARYALPSDQISLVLATTAAACAAMGAVLAAVVHRMSTNRGAAWISAALTMYGVVVVPAITIGTTVDRGAPVVMAIRFVAPVIMITLLFIAVWSPPRRHAIRPLTISLAGLSVVVAAAVLALVAPGATELVTSNAGSWIGLACSLCLAGFALALVSVARGSAPLARVGIGMAVIGLGYAYKVSKHAPVNEVGLTYASVRLLGVLVMLVGLVQLARVTLQIAHEAHLEHQEELRLAKVGLARVEERDHELRNGIAGLAGMTHLLVDSNIDDSGSLCVTVSAELARLESMLANSAENTRSVYLTGSVISDLTALRKRAGMNIHCEVEDDLWTEGSRNALAQVLTNVLANCARHAPGSPVRVWAFRWRGRIRICVSDSGPGVPPGQEDLAFARGTRGEHSQGQGLGLHICRELLAADGATIELCSAVPTGATVVVELPLIARPRAHADVAAVASAG